MQGLRRRRRIARDDLPRWMTLCLVLVISAMVAALAWYIAGFGGQTALMAGAATGAVAAGLAAVSRTAFVVLVGAIEWVLTVIEVALITAASVLTALLG